MCVCETSLSLCTVVLIHIIQTRFGMVSSPSCGLGLVNNYVTCIGIHRQLVGQVFIAQLVIMFHSYIYVVTFAIKHNINHLDYKSK